MIPFKLLLLIIVIWIQLPHSSSKVVQLREWANYDNKTKTLLSDRYPNARPYVQSGATVWWYDAAFYCKRHKKFCATFSYEREHLIMANERLEYLGLTCTDNGKLSHEVMVEIRELNFRKFFHPVVIVHHNCAGKKTIKKFTLKLPEIPITERMGYHHYEHIIRSPYMGEISNDAAGQEYRNKTLKSVRSEERNSTEAWLNGEDYSMYSVYPYRYVERLNGKCNSNRKSLHLSDHSCRISYSHVGSYSSQYNQPKA